ncbi:response regulator transcription factor [Chelativorans salis]|uniref:Response regulator transcription factor n=1 Tax=Chelativorans salis TaxID=2978478 RepID=A0ABT2LUP0_9HYPH|nr:response regulator transcription factor [Chelativorans sp. EGI FJ00035]MCT7378250.1 response regulator transcription factor [Chelativorans sp. EGI FJ00035]
MKPLVVICSQSAEFYLILEHILRVDGFDSVLAGNLEEALRLAAETTPAAFVLDCGRNGLFGPDLCTRLKQEEVTRAIPVVGLIAPGAEDQHIALLKAGVDESLVRPVAPAKLLDYLRARLPRAQQPLSALGGGDTLVYGDLEIRPESGRVRCGGKEVQLGAIEFRLLRVLLEYPDRTFGRAELIAAAWPENIHVSARTVDVHISRLRKALRRLGRRDLIRTVRAAGYTLNDENGA